MKRLGEGPTDSKRQSQELVRAGATGTPPVAHSDHRMGERGNFYLSRVNKLLSCSTQLSGGCVMPGQLGWMHLLNKDH